MDGRKAASSGTNAERARGSRSGRRPAPCPRSPSSRAPRSNGTTPARRPLPLALLSPARSPQRSIVAPSPWPWLRPAPPASTGSAGGGARPRRGPARRPRRTAARHPGRRTPPGPRRCRPGRGARSQPTAPRRCRPEGCQSWAAPGPRPPRARPRGVQTRRLRTMRSPSCSPGTPPRPADPPGWTRFPQGEAFSDDALRGWAPRCLRRRRRRGHASPA
mmetsp:Transcript_106002/g.330607  ORF Transcript_106002/g.330607 Transcript_106002/m.330607 type:complete len:218 (-) Transcript_106002:184-837(-)